MSATVKRWIGRLFTLFCLVFSAAAFFNVYGDNAETESLARAAAACPGDQCTVTRLDRTPFAQEFEFSRRGQSTTVRCVRAALVVGAYACLKR